MSVVANRACIGAFCHLREKCVHHVELVRPDLPAERLCIPGQEMAMFFKPAEARQP